MVEVLISKLSAVHGDASDSAITNQSPHHGSLNDLRVLELHGKSGLPAMVALQGGARCVITAVSRHPGKGSREETQREPQHRELAGAFLRILDRRPIDNRVTVS